jgi:predicted house-cleaning noncanonical NTP pyrophosphatase (MazG superfamily)
MTGAEIPMQVPMSSEKDGLKTWFVPIPFQNDDFVPSVSVSDDLFFATTSKRFAEGLSSLAAKGGGESRQGVWLDVDMKVLHSYAEQWLKLIEENAAEFMSDVELEDFNANKEMIETTLSALGMMDSLTYHMRQEDGVTRTSMHLKTK